jgi:hypothetical protein
MTSVANASWNESLETYHDQNFLKETTRDYDMKKKSDNNDDHGGDNNKKNNTPHFMLTAAHTALVIVLTGIIALLFAQHSAPKGVVVEGWVISPSVCSLWLDGSCISVHQHEKEASALTLGGQMPEYERPSTGFLLSSVHPAFFCLVVEVLSLAFVWKGEHEENVHKIIKRFSLAVLCVYGSLFLFIQHNWTIPTNNLLLVEVLMLAGLFFISTYSSFLPNQNSIYHRVGLVLTAPLLAVAALGAAGEDNTLALLLVFVSLTSACLLLLIMTLETEERGVLRMALWLCIVPFVVQSAVRLQFLAELSVGKPSMWTEAALGLTLGLYLLAMVFVTVSLFWGYTVSTYAWEVGDFVIKCTVTLLIVVGLYSES